jgi:hypothetical protein
MDSAFPVAGGLERPDQRRISEAVDLNGDCGGYFFEGSLGVAKGLCCWPLFRRADAPGRGIP